MAEIILLALVRMKFSGISQIYIFWQLPGLFSSDMSQIIIYSIYSLHMERTRYVVILME